MTYPMAHKVIKRFPYTTAANTNIRDTFEKARRDAANKANHVLDSDPVPAGAQAGNESGISTAECH
jgi:hypothetical protein